MSTRNKREPSLKNPLAFAVSDIEAKAAVELVSRGDMAVRIFRPQPHQDEIFRMPRSKLNLILGGNRCFAQGTLVNTPEGYRRIDCVSVGDVVLGVEGLAPISTEVVSTHRFESSGIKVRLVTGDWCVVTEDHGFLIQTGEFILAKDLAGSEEIGRYSDGRIDFFPIESISLVESEEFYAISTASETIIANDFASHNSGKSTCAAVLTAAIAMDQKIILSDGTVVESRMPHQKDRCLRIFIVSYDQETIGTVIHRLLLKSSLFKVVRDPATKELRAYDPTKDVGLKPKGSPPLIPARYIKTIAWDSRADNIFSRITVQDPATKKEIAEIHAYSSKGEPPQGSPCDWIWIDESCAGGESYVSEMKARLVDLDGAFIWSSWPDVRTEGLQMFTEMIDRELEAGNTDMARKVTLTMSGNKHLGAKAIRDFLAGCATPEEMEARDKGAFVTERLRMFPLFDKHVHSAIIDGPLEDDLSRVLRKTDGIPSNEWTKYLILDPGTNSPAILLCAVPPPELGPYLVPYMQIYPGRADAKQLAKIVKRDAGNERFYRFIVDWHAARQTPMGFDTRIIDVYEDCFESEGIRCAATRHRFARSSDQVGGRQLILNSAMHPINNTGLPKLRIVAHRCPDLCKQLEKIKKHVVSKEVKDERKAPGTVSDLVDCAEYFVASHPRYVYVQPRPEEASTAYRRYMAKFGKSTQDEPSISIGTFYD